MWVLQGEKCCCSYPTYLPEARAAELKKNAEQICSKGRGILAADESTGTIGKRFDGIKCPNTEENRGAYRHLLFSTEGLNKHISGCILYEETLFQTYNGVRLVDLLTKQGIIPGIKVDMGLVELPGTDGEKSTTGLDGLDKRCQKYYEAGARFAKWRAVLEIDCKKGKPSHLSIKETAHTLARYAAICQQNGLVPIVEPEILSDGDHSIEVCAAATERTLAAVFKALSDHHVYLEGCLLKPNMVTRGAENKTDVSVDKTAEATLQVLKRTAPPALVGVTFLSGGQSEESASKHLNAMNTKEIKQKMNRNGGDHPWALTFSYGRALQATVLEVWKGKPENVKAAQKALLARAEANGLAEQGLYKGGVATQKGQFEKGYVY